MQIYLARNNVQAGPYSLQEVNTMLTTGEVMLSDLAWHQGMQAWQPLGELTGGQMFYNPPMPSNPTTQPPFAQSLQDPAVKHDDGRRLSVAELYGKNDGANDSQSQSVWTKSASEPVVDEVTYASVPARFLAFSLNMVLFVLTFMPLQMAVLNSGIDLENLNPKSLADYQALGEQISASLSPSLIMTTFGLMVVLAFLQTVLLAVRGQSIGKLLTGIRVVDEKTHKVPAFGAMVGIRVLLLFFFYQLTSSLFQVVAIVMMVANYIMAAQSPKKQGWHDKLAKTVVVKARPNQLKKDK